MTNPDKKSSLFSKIETKEDALKTIKECSIAFYVVAAIQGAIGWFIAPAMLFDAFLFVALAFALRRWKSRSAAITLLVFVGITTVSTLMNRLNIAHEGGNNIILAVIVLMAAIRATYATFVFQRKFATESVV